MSVITPVLSVIIPVYKVEDYLVQTLDSIVGQSLGFAENIELILVNDGSPDDSETICLRYKERFPDNIVYIKQENAGVSAARNEGLRHARGTYVHFMDSDDIISRNFYKKSLDFLKRYTSEIDFVASKIKYFDARYVHHYLNAKFKRTRIIDTTLEPSLSVFHLPTVVFKKSVLENTRFDTKLKVSEDARLLNEVLFKKKKYGVVSNTCYYYRKRLNAVSAIDTKLSNKSYFIDTPERFLNHLLGIWRDEDGSLLRYIQYLVMNDIAWKVSEEKVQKILNENEERQYKQTIYSIVKQIDDDIIASNKILNLDQKTFLLRKKHGSKQYERSISTKGSTYYFQDSKLLTFSLQNEDAALVFDFIHDLGNGKYKIEGFAQKATISSRDKRYLKTSKGLHELIPVPRSQRQDGFLSDAFTDNEAFEVVIEVGATDTICGILEAFEGKNIPIPIFTKNFTGLGVLNTTYCQKGKVIFRKNHNMIEVHENTRKNRLKFEFRFSLQVLRNIQLRQVIDWAKRTAANIDSLVKFAPLKTLLWELAGPLALLLRSASMGVWDVILRQLYFAGMYKNNRPIWLISDRGTVAGDNGEALFRYIVENEQPNADVYFAISKKSPDYERLQKIGKVVNIDGFRYKMFFLRAEKIISSAADYYVYNAFGYRWTHFSDLYNFDFIFLQHGIIQADLSTWLNRFEKNIKIFVTSAKPEYESILKGPYYYTRYDVLLSGLPRYDLLDSVPKNKLMLAPTWRQNLLPEERHGKSGIREYSSTFKDTEYFKFYNALMNDKRVIKVLKNAGMAGELYLHPAFSRQARDFQGNEVFRVKKLPYNYKKAFRESDILITDYSSVAFDFAYLRKPIIYSQFDSGSLHENHISNQGYFSYENNGFGEVVYDYESTINLIVDTIKHSSVMSQKYAARVDSFFAFNDRNNCQRVYNAIISLQ